jgi:uncharacterized protein YndB with AHSA1/START domain
MNTRLPLVTLSLLLSASAAEAEVSETRENAFVIQSIVMADNPPAKVYRDLVRVAQWWDPAHTWSGSAKNLRLEPRAGGCFCEKLPEGGSVQHGRVLFAQPGKLLRLEAALGPLQEMAVSAVLTFSLAPDGPGTRITMTYRVNGSLTMDSAKLAPGVDQVMGIQLRRLRDLASGRPVGSS